jgi:hypothetical protein
MHCFVAEGLVARRSECDYDSLYQRLIGIPIFSSVSRILAKGDRQEDSIERDEIGRRIRTLRKSREFSIQRLSELTGISAGYLSEVERGASAPSGEKLARLAAELGSTIDYLLTGHQSHSAVHVPGGLAAAAEKLNLTYAQTVRLLGGKLSLVARRSAGGSDDEWSEADWIDFYNKVKPYL